MIINVKKSGSVIELMSFKVRVLGIFGGHIDEKLALDLGFFVTWCDIAKSLQNSRSCWASESWNNHLKSVAWSAEPHWVVGCNLLDLQFTLDSTAAPTQQQTDRLYQFQAKEKKTSSSSPRKALSISFGFLCFIKCSCVGGNVHSRVAQKTT